LIPVFTPKLPNEIRNDKLCLDVSKQEVEAREMSEGVKITEELNPNPQCINTGIQSIQPQIRQFLRTIKQRKHCN